MKPVKLPKDSVFIQDIDVDIATYYSGGMKTKMVGKKLKLSPRTIEFRIGQMKKKLKCNNITHLMCELLRNGIIK